MNGVVFNHTALCDVGSRPVYGNCFFTLTFPLSYVESVTSPLFKNATIILIEAIGWLVIALVTCEGKTLDKTLSLPG